MAKGIVAFNAGEIREKIFTIRGLQVILDRDLAALYGVETKVLNQAVKRNIVRFPAEFMLQLTESEFGILRSQSVTSNWKSQFVTSNKDKMGLRKRPFAFTEQGVAMLSGVLKSDVAVRISIQIIKAFVVMRKFIASNAQIFQRLDYVELKQLEYKKETNKKFDEIFDAIEHKEIKVKQGIFFNGQIFDAHAFVSSIIRDAQKTIVLIDNFVDDSVLTLFNKRKKGVNVTIFTKNISKELALDLEKYNSQYPPIVIKEFGDSHDRFLIIDNNKVYHFGASLKDLGKKWFAFSKFDKDAFRILERLKAVKNEGGLK